MKKTTDFRKALVAVCLLASRVLAQEQGMELSGFRVPEYNDQGVMTAQLFGRRAEVRASGVVKIDKLLLEFYQAGEKFVTVEAPFCFYNSQTREAQSDSEVVAVADKIEVKGRGFEWKPSLHNIRIFNDVHVVLENTGGLTSPLLSGELTSPLLSDSQTATGGVVTITSSELFLDYTAKIVQFEKNVRVKNSDGTEMNCDKLKIPLGEGRDAGFLTLPGMTEVGRE